jgi:hypothetical protein
VASGSRWTIAERAGGCQRLSSLGVRWLEWAGVGGVAGGGGLFRSWHPFCPSGAKLQVPVRTGQSNGFGGHFYIFPQKEKLPHTRALAQTRIRARVPARLRAPATCATPSQRQNVKVSRFQRLRGAKWVPRVGREGQSVTGRLNRLAGCTNPLPFAAPLGRMGASTVLNHRRRPINNP